MSRFAYRAMAAEGRMIEGVVRAASRERAIDTLRSRAVVPLSVRPVGHSRRGLGTLLEALAAGPGALAELTRELEILLGAGVTLERALAMLAATASPAGGLAQDLLDRVRGGASLAAAMQQHPGVFPAYYVGTVRAGEEGGTLDLVLGRLAAMLERDAALRATIRGALAYPLLVLCLSGLTMAVLLVYVIPEFQPVFEQAGRELPLATRLVLAASDLTVRGGWLVALLLLGGWLALRQAAQSPAGRLWRDRLLVRLPLIGTLLLRVETARFCRTLGTLVVNGVALVAAVRIAGDALGNRSLGRATQETVAALTRGEPVVAALGQAGWIPERARHLAAVGVESGRLGDMLLRIADIYEAEAERVVQRLVGLIAPVATILLGCLIAFMIGSILSAILGSYDLAV